MTIPIRPLGFIDEIQLTTGWLFEFSVLRQNPQIRLLLSLLIRLVPKSPVVRPALRHPWSTAHHPGDLMSCNTILL
jgi:hypothetical protein